MLELIVDQISINLGTTFPRIQLTIFPDSKLEQQIHFNYVASMLVLAKSWCFDDDADDDLPSAAAGNCISPDKTEIFVATLKVKN